MTSALTAAGNADQLLGELTAPAFETPAPTMGRLKRCSYTHKALVDLIIERPDMDQNHLAAHFGYSPAWISNILASEAFQAQLATRREQVIDPVLKATLKERFDALVRQSIDVLQAKLAQPDCPPQVALKAAELGAKAMGLGGHAPAAPVRESSSERIQRLAKRLVGIKVNSEGMVIHAEETYVEAGAEGSGVSDLGEERGVIQGQGSRVDVAG